MNATHTMCHSLVLYTFTHQRSVFAQPCRGQTLMENTLEGPSLSEGGWAEYPLKVCCPRGWRDEGMGTPKGERGECVFFFFFADVHLLSGDGWGGGERGVTAVFLIASIFSKPAWGCGKCQPLIELIKPFWVSGMNMVSTTKGHCIRQPPLGGPRGIKGLLARVFTCALRRAFRICLAVLVDRWEGERVGWMGVGGRGEGQMTGALPLNKRFLFFCCERGFELIWINSFCLGRGGENGVCAFVCACRRDRQRSYPLAL